MISYAQNLEDVVLNRLFDNKRNGFYIDINPHDPVEFSVTKHFYDLGWRGINIEPVPESYTNFKLQRPEDININIAIGARHELSPYYMIPGYPGLGSLKREIATSAGKLVGSAVRSITVDVLTLAELCEKYCDEIIDFVKIDVEGCEREVIQGGDWINFRPTMLVIKVTVLSLGGIEEWETPETIAHWKEWEQLVFDADYILVYNDGYNRYYLRKEDEHLKQKFSLPISLLRDDFSLHNHIRKQRLLQNEKEKLKEKVNNLNDDIDLLNKEKEDLKEKIHILNNNNQRLKNELSKEKEASQEKDLTLNTLRSTLEEERFINSQSLIQRLLSFFIFKNNMKIRKGFSKLSRR